MLQSQVLALLIARECPQVQEFFSDVEHCFEPRAMLIRGVLPKGERVLLFGLQFSMSVGSFSDNSITFCDEAKLSHVVPSTLI